MPHRRIAGSLACGRGRTRTRRGDMLAPWEAPFGEPLVRALSDGLRRAVLTPLLGPAASLDFISLLYVKSGAQAQSWHGEGRLPQLVAASRAAADWTVRARTLKVQVVLHDLPRAHGMVHFARPLVDGPERGRGRALEQHSPFGALPTWRRMAPEALQAGSVVLYNPQARRRGAHWGAGLRGPPRPRRLRSVSRPWSSRGHRNCSLRQDAASCLHRRRCTAAAPTKCRAGRPRWCST